MLKTLMVTATALAAATLAGCHSPGGGVMSYTGGSHVYRSAETRPLSVTLIDLRSDEVLFQMDIPAGKELTIQFEPGEGDDTYTPDIMRYSVLPAGSHTGRLQSAMTVPAAWARRLDVDVRPGSEFASIPPEREFRTDELADRPDWWTPEGGALPENHRGLASYDD